MSDDLQITVEWYVHLASGGASHLEVHEGEISVDGDWVGKYCFSDCEDDPDYGYELEGEWVDKGELGICVTEYLDQFYSSAETIHGINTQRFRDVTDFTEDYSRFIHQHPEREEVITYFKVSDRNGVVLYHYDQWEEELQEDSGQG